MEFLDNMPSASAKLGLIVLMLLTYSLLVAYPSDEGMGYVVTDGDSDWRRDADTPFGRAGQDIGTA